MNKQPTVKSTYRIFSTVTAYQALYPDIVESLQALAAQAHTDSSWWPVSPCVSSDPTADGFEVAPSFFTEDS